MVGTILNQASQNGQKVFVGLGRGDDLLLTWDGFHDPARIAAGLNHGTQIAAELWNLYRHEPSFFGWYLTHEANDIQQASAAYYNPMTDILREFEADKPVMISPAGTPIISPMILADSHVGIFAYQDAVGAGYIPYQNTFDPQQRIDMLDAVFSSYQNAHNGVDKHLWANLENWQMAGPTYGNPYPADFSRVLQQLDIEKNYVDVISSYEWLGFMEHPESTVVLGGQRAVDLYTDYRDYYEQVRSSLKSVNYVVNPGFENGTGLDGTTPIGWHFSGSGSGQVVSLSSDTPTNSATSLSLNIDQADGLPWLIQDIPIRAGAEYKFSVWAKELEAEPSDGWLAAQVWMLSDSRSGTILDSVALLFQETTWDFQSTFITAPAEAGIARLVFAIQDNAFGVGGGHYLLDGVELVGPSVGPDFNSDGVLDCIDVDGLVAEIASGANGGPFDLTGDGEVNLDDLDQWLVEAGAANLPSRAAYLPGDANLDGVVDGQDFIVWNDHKFTATTGWCRADFNADGGVDGQDFITWNDRKFTSAERGISAVPEPSSRLLCGFMLCAWWLAMRPRVAFRAVTIIGLLLVTVQTTSAHEPANLPSTSKPSYASSMTLVPPVSVSNHVEIEIRVAVRNHTTKKARFELVLSVDTADGEARPLIGTPLEVSALGQELISSRLLTGEYVGQNTVRYHITGPDGFTESGRWPLEVVACESRALPLLQVGWLDPGAMVPEAYAQRRHPAEQDLRDAIDHYHAIGMAGLIITYPESIYLEQGVFYPSRVFRDEGTRVSFDVVGTILNQASKNGQHVFVGLGRGPDLLLTWTGFDDQSRKQAVLAHSMKTATELWVLYGHEPSFYGWYLTHEANDIARASKAYYNPITQFLRTFRADKPVLISPAGTPILSPQALAESEVDIFAYQDAVGSGYVPYQNTFDPQRRMEMLPEVYATYARAHRDSGKHLWANLEIWQMDGPEYGNSYPPDFERVQEQLKMEQQHVDVITTYTLLGFMEPPASTVELGGPKAVRLFEAYRNYYQRITIQDGFRRAAPFQPNGH